MLLALSLDEIVFIDYVATLGILLLLSKQKAECVFVSTMCCMDYYQCLLENAGNPKKH